MVLIPYAGKYFGRKFAYWSRFLTKLQREGVITDHGTRLGKNYAVEISGRGQIYKSDCFQSCWGNRGCCNTINVAMKGCNKHMIWT